MSQDGSQDGDKSGAFFGRRKGKRLRPGQDERTRTLLPQLRIGPSGPEGADGKAPLRLEDLPALFPRRPSRIAVEIGFGGGEHLAHRARSHPDMGFIGCEPFVNGVAKLLGTVAAEGLDNIRLWDRDATELLPLLPPASVQEVDLLYPDPWPKRRQRKRRFVSDDSLRALARILRPGGRFRFATDIDDYAGWTLARALRSSEFRWLAERADDWRRPWDDWPGTRYEAKARLEGRTPAYLTFERI